MSGDFVPSENVDKNTPDCVGGYRIEGNITEIEYRLKSDAMHSISFVPGQNHTVFVDGQKRAVFVPVSYTAKKAYLLAYDKKLTIEFNPNIQFDFKLGECTLTFVKKGVDGAPNEEGITVMIESDFMDQKISDLQIVKYGIRQ